jgi:hypothetical protein
MTQTISINLDSELYKDGVLVDALLYGPEDDLEPKWFLRVTLHRPAFIARTNFKAHVVRF